MIGKIAAWVGFIIFLILYAGVIIVGIMNPLLGMFTGIIAWIFGIISFIFLVIAIVLTVTGK